MCLILRRLSRGCRMVTDACEATSAACDSWATSHCHSRIGSMQVRSYGDLACCDARNCMCSCVCMLLFKLGSECSFRCVLLLMRCTLTLLHVHYVSVGCRQLTRGGYGGCRWWRTSVACSCGLRSLRGTATVEVRSVAGFVPSCVCLRLYSQQLQWKPC
jgi:hypothetical protein